MTNGLHRLTAALIRSYRIERELGAGGMATVYLAHDLKHQRDVAIKVLHPDLGAALGGERFLSEIRTTARLQHPHILPLLDSGDADGLLYYVMPLVTGETLRTRLERDRQLPIEEALRIAREVADALGYAHSHHVIHRDIKPENILLQDGHALVADFGIALAVQSAGGQRMTQTGLSLGTPQYMSPEQAMGERAIDARSDIYALGAVTYEMLAGDPPFTGSSVQAIVAKVMTERPSPISTVRDTVPGYVEAAVLTALAKLPADRFATAPAFAAALSTPTGFTSAAVIPRPPAASLRRSLLLGAGVMALVAMAFVAGRRMHSGGQEGSAPFGRATQVTWEPGLEITPALSPDGKQVAYSSGNGTQSTIYVRPVAGGRAVPLTGDSVAVETHPQWSPDGTRILYLSNLQVFSAPSGGGPPRQEVPTQVSGVMTATWSPDAQRIAYATNDTIFVRTADGTSHLLAPLYSPLLCTWGSRDLIACSSGNALYLTPGVAFGNIAPSWIAIINARNGHVSAVTDSSSSSQSPRWSADGRELFFASNAQGLPDIYSVAVNGQGSAAGKPRRLTVGLNVSTFSLSADRRAVAYAVLTVSANVWSQPWTSRALPAGSRPTQVTFGQQTIENFSISHDGHWLFYDSDLAGNSDLYRMPLPAGVPERLTSDPTPEFAPDPSPDGRRVAFHSWRGGSRDIYILSLDGGPIERVTNTPAQEGLPKWSPDGATLTFISVTPPSRIFLSHRGSNGEWQTTTRLNEGYWSQWSPDGSLLSYATSLNGGNLRVVPTDSGAARNLYDERRPGAPLAETSFWSDEGRTVYFKSHAASGAASIWSIPVGGGTPQHVLDLGDERLRSDRYGFRIAQGKLYFTLYDRQSNIWVMDMTR